MTAASIAATGPLLAAVAVSATAGAISFATPCVLPLVPGYLAFVSGLTGVGATATARPIGDRQAHGLGDPERTGRGATASELAPPRPPRASVIGASLFVLGFTAVFTLLGGAFGAAGQALAAHRQLIEIFGGLLMIAMGLFMLGVLRAPGLQRDSRPWQVIPRGGLLTAFPLGVVFGAGWTPCIGPTLASILTLSAAGHASAARGAVLAASYALGLGMPLILLAVGVHRVVRGVAFLRRHTRQVELAGGTLLLIVGVLLVTGLWSGSLNALRPWLGHFTSPI